MPDRERNKLSLSVLAAGATLLCAAIALVALIAGPNPQGTKPDAVAERAAPSPSVSPPPKPEVAKAEQAAAPPAQPTPVPSAAPEPAAADPISTGALPDHSVPDPAVEAAPAPVIAAPALETSPTQTRADDPSYMADAKSERVVSSPTISRADEPETTIASAEPARPAEASPPAPVPRAALDISATQTREGPSPAEPKVEWAEPAAPVTVEPAPPLVVAEAAAPESQAAPAKAEPAPPRVGRPKQIARAEAPARRGKMTPMMVGTGGTIEKPQAPAKQAGAGSYASTVRSAIGRNKAQASGRGSATVTFAIGPGGGLRGAKISKSSGNSALDQAALASVRRAGPFPKPPAGAKSTYSIQIYFH